MAILQTVISRETHPNLHCIFPQYRYRKFMMKSSNRDIFRVTDHLCGEFTGRRWIPRTKASDAEHWCFFYLRLNERLSKQRWGWWFETPSRPLWHHRNVEQFLMSLGEVLMIALTYPHAIKFWQAFLCCYGGSFLWIYFRQTVCNDTCILSSHGTLLVCLWHSLKIQDSRFKHRLFRGNTDIHIYITIMDTWQNMFLNGNII